LHARLDGVRCPALWLQGTANEVYSVANAQGEIKLFVNSAQPSCGSSKGVNTS